MSSNVGIEGSRDLIRLAINCFIMFFLGISFDTKNNQQHTFYSLLQSLNKTHPNCIMMSPVVKIAQKMKDKKWIKQNIGVGYLVKGKGSKDGVKYKRGKNQGDEERGGGLCPGCGG